MAFLTRQVHVHMQERDNSLVQTVLYCSSGCLWNLSRHPGNRDALYAAELEVRLRLWVQAQHTPSCTWGVVHVPLSRQVCTVRGMGALSPLRRALHFGVCAHCKGAW